MSRWWRSVFCSCKLLLTHSNTQLWSGGGKTAFFLNEIIIDQMFLVCLRRLLCPDAACVLSGADQMFVISSAANEWINSAHICGSWACVRLSCRVPSTPTGSVTTFGRLSWTTWSSERWPTWWRWTRSRLWPVTGRANPCKINWINGEFERLMHAGVHQGRCTLLWRHLRTLVPTSGHGTNMLVVCFLSADWTLTSVTWPGVYI